LGASVLQRDSQDGVREAGAQGVVTWDGRNDAGQAVASRVYFVKMSAPRFSKTIKAVVIK
jgi:hypothetical protein